MRKFLTVLLLTASTLVFSQGNTLFHSRMVKPKVGQSGAFETSWKAHLAKFHKNDDKRIVYEFIDGDYTGFYLLVDGPSSFADMDKENPTNKAHDQDYNATIALKTEMETGSSIYRMVDTLSYNPGVKADKYVYNIINVKSGKMADFMAEIKRALKVNESINSPVSTTVYVKMGAGSSPQMVLVSNLKNGFKQLEQNFFTGLTDKFKEGYIKMYSQAAWDKRLTYLQDLTENYSSYLVKRRSDLSSL